MATALDTIMNVGEEEIKRIVSKTLTTPDLILRHHTTGTGRVGEEEGNFCEIYLQIICLIVMIIRGGGGGGGNFSRGNSRVSSPSRSVRGNSPQSQSSRGNSRRNSPSNFSRTDSPVRHTQVFYRLVEIKVEEVLCQVNVIK